MAKIIIVANQKGGVGKTTTSICVGSSLAKLNKKVLLIDLDPQGNSTIALGINSERNNRTVFAALSEKTAIQKTIKKTIMEGFDIIPSNITLTFFNDENSKFGDEKEFILKKQIDEISDLYDYIIIDTPPSNGLITINALTCGNSVIIPLQCEYFAMESITTILALIRKIKTTTNPNLEIEGFLFTMYDSNDQLCVSVGNEIRSIFSHQVFEIVIPRNNSIPESQSKGIPTILFRPTSIGATAYLSLAKLIINKEKTSSI